MIRPCKNCKDQWPVIAVTLISAGGREVYFKVSSDSLKLFPPPNLKQSQILFLTCNKKMWYLRIFLSKQFACKYTNGWKKVLLVCLDAPYGKKCVCLDLRCLLRLWKYSTYFPTTRANIKGSHGIEYKLLYKSQKGDENWNDLIKIKLTSYWNKKNIK